MAFETIKRLAVADGERQASAPHLAGGREVQRYLVAALAAAIPCLVTATRYFGPRVLAMVLVAFAAGAVVETAFACIRKKPIGGGSLVFAILLVLILPPEIPLWMVAVSSAFGVFFGKEVFGGTGYHIFSPVLLGKGFLMFSYPQIVKGTYFGSMLECSHTDAWVVCSAVILLGAVAMIAARPANMLILAGILFGAVSLGNSFQITGRLPFGTLLEMVAADGFLFGACFLACDPACSPRHKAGKLLYGLLIGSVAVLMRSFSLYSEAMLSAILIGNLFTPTIDVLVRRGAENETR